jgi:hypothetical protein
VEVEAGDFFYCINSRDRGPVLKLKRKKPGARRSGPHAQVPHVDTRICLRGV